MAITYGGDGPSGTRIRRTYARESELDRWRQGTTHRLSPMVANATIRARFRDLQENSPYAGDSTRAWWPKTAYATLVSEQENSSALAHDGGKQVDVRTQRKQTSAFGPQRLPTLG